MRIVHGVVLLGIGVFVGASTLRSSPPPVAPPIVSTQAPRELMPEAERPPAPAQPILDTQKNMAPSPAVNLDDPRSRGLVLYNGDWITPEDRDGRIKAESSQVAVKPAAALPPQTTSPEPTAGFTPTGIPQYVGPRGGIYHYSKNGNKVYAKKKR